MATPAAVLDGLDVGDPPPLYVPRRVRPREVPAPHGALGPAELPRDELVDLEAAVGHAADEDVVPGGEGAHLGDLVRVLALEHLHAVRVEVAGGVVDRVGRAGGAVVGGNPGVQVPNLERTEVTSLSASGMSTELLME